MSLLFNMLSRLLTAFLPRSKCLLISWLPVELLQIQNGLNDPEKHHGVITHLELDILECEVKWALGSITMSKTSRADKILAELFKIPEGGALLFFYFIF